jgi:putative Holliday junction resolvase
MRILALDVGTKRVGLAISDETATISTALGFIKRSDKKFFERISRIVKEDNVKEIVVGLPVSLKGHDNKSTEDARSLAEQIKNRTGAGIIMWDERLTTRQADRALLDAGVDGRKRRTLRDQVSAAIILQNYLDSRKRG